MLLNDVQEKQEKSLLNYIDSDIFKMIFTDECVFKIVKKKEIEKMMFRSRKL